MPKPKPGRYVLARDVPNPHPDKRHRYDWRKQAVFPKGLPITAAVDNLSSGVAGFEVVALISGKYSHQRIMPHEGVYHALVEAMVPDASVTPQEAIDNVVAALRKIVAEFKLGRTPLANDIRVAEEALDVYDSHKGD